MPRRTHADPKKQKGWAHYVLEDLGNSVRPVPLAYRLAFANSHLRCRKQTHVSKHIHPQRERVCVCVRAPHFWYISKHFIERSRQDSNPPKESNQTFRRGLTPADCMESLYAGCAGEGQARGLS